MTELQKLELKKLELQLLLLKEEAKSKGIVIKDHSPESCTEFSKKEPFFNKHLKAWIIPSSWSGTRWAKWLGFDSVEWPIEPSVIHQLNAELDEDETDEETEKAEIEIPDVSPAGEPYTSNFPPQNTES